LRYRTLSFLTAGAVAAALVLIVPDRASAQYPGQYAVSINGSPVSLSPAPIERGGRVFVPLRGVFENLGASVVYDAGQINATSSAHNVSLRVGSNQAIVDGATQVLETPPFIVGASTYVPLRFVSQALGATVNYESSNRMVSITTNGSTRGAVRTSAAGLPAGTTLVGSLTRDLNTATAQIGDTFAINLAPPYPNDDPAYANGYVRGHVFNVTRSGQGTNAQLGLAFDQIVFADGHTMPIYGHVTNIDEQHKSAILQQAAGALGGMLVGNALGKILFKTNLGGAAGAAGGFLYANNLKTNFTVPQGSSITLVTDQPRRQPIRQ
jgi:hypothetical protein